MIALLLIFPIAPGEETYWLGLVQRRGKMAVGDMGFAAYFKDSEENVIGLWQSA